MAADTAASPAMQSRGGALLQAKWGCLAGSGAAPSSGAEDGMPCRDGEDHNLSWNCGVEGATPKAPVLNLRARQARPCPCLVLMQQQRCARHLSCT